MIRSGGRQTDRPMSSAPAGTPWWHFPTPLGVSHIQNAATPCWGDEVIAENGESFGLQVPCGSWMPNSQFGNWPAYYDPKTGRGGP